MSLAVVIPFYQRSPGLLRRALTSVFEQVDIDDVTVVVVDDTSPVDAQSELDAFGPTPRFPVRVIRQPNGGPAAARNRALDALGDDVGRVAFLDSDDEWEPMHLAHAVTALDAGHDFYFADLYQPGQSVSAFQRAGRLHLAEHPAIANSSALHTYRGDMFDQIIGGNVIGTSTVVYDFRRFAQQRFDEAFYSAGEDYLFWIACAQAGARFAFSTAVEVRYGYGVNVYAGSGWGTDGFLRRVHNEMRYRKRLLGMALTDVQRRFVGDKLVDLRREFAMGLIHRVMAKQPVDPPLLKAQFQLDPLTLFAVPTVAGKAAADRLRGRAAS